VTDALNPAGEPFGEEKVVALFAGSGTATAEETVNNIHHAVLGHAAGTMQADDITLMAVRYCPAASLSTHT
jgi:serine phosphatase RsbU (regulator of sigma subunit)